MDPVISLLSELVAIDSVNPALVPGGAGERAIAAFIAAELRRAGLSVVQLEVAPGRPNVVGLLEGRSSGRSLMLCGHIDTVGVAGMSAPFTPLIADGRLYGRGAEDMKGGLAAMMDAARLVAQGGGIQAGRLLIAAVCDEEYASLGAEALVTGWQADAAVIAEPTHLGIATGHRGFTWIEVMTQGIAAHGSRPHEGRDAILKMGRILERLESLDRKLQSRPAHAVMGTASLHASLIEGGRELSTYPDRCTMKMERRNIVGETGETALAEVECLLSALRAEDPDLRASATVLFDRLPYELAPDHSLILALEDALRTAGHTPCRGGTSFWTDAAVLGHAGIPSVIFGPGGGGLHSSVEYVEVEEVLTCRDALAELARRFCR